MENAKIIELLAPAGNFAKLKTAFLYGADAVYLGGQAFGLRANADNFTDEQIIEAVELANSLGKKVYVTLNIIARDNDFDGLLKYAKFLEKAGVHGVIVADIGTFMLLRENCPNLPIHVSTQANNLNYKTIEFWLKNGATRVNLARELSLEEIKQIDFNLKLHMPELATADEPYLEAFVHGAMCMSYSGRCMLSDYFTGRSSNRGDCAQPCRWNYYISEEKRPGEYFPVFENERGTFLFNSKDLCMLPHLPKLLETGVTSLKIEGRMKSEFYTATTVRAYRIAIDECMKDPIAYAGNKELIDTLMSELCATSHRDYSTGFYFGNKGEEIFSESSYKRETDFIGVTENRSAGKIFIRLRGAIKPGDKMEIITPNSAEIIEVAAENLTDEEGKKLEKATIAGNLVSIDAPTEISANVPEGSMVRKRIG